MKPVTFEVKDRDGQHIGEFEVTAEKAGEVALLLGFSGAGADGANLSDVTGKLEEAEKKQAELTDTITTLEQENGELTEKVTGLEKQDAELSEKVAGLEKQDADLNEKASAMDDLGDLLSTPEGFVQFATNAGYGEMLKDEKANTSEPGKDKRVLQGKVDRPGYRYFAGLGPMGLSIKVEKEA